MLPGPAGMLSQSNHDTSAPLSAGFNWSPDLPRCCWTGVACAGDGNESVVVSLNISTLVGFDGESLRLNANWFFCE